MDALDMENALASWADGRAKECLIAFLRETTQGPSALPPAERVAAFDNDGTLACEKPHTALSAFLRHQLDLEELPAADLGGGSQVLRELGLLFAGRTTADYEAHATRFLAQAQHPRFHRPYSWMTYQPMLELVTLLVTLEFSVFLVTDSSRDFMRVIAGPAYRLRREHVIGSEVQIQCLDGQLVRTATPVPMDDGPGKVAHLWDRAGARPVLAAGNAAGDIAMLSAARYALVVHHDDPVREYAYTDQDILDAAAANHWSVLSIREDFTGLWPATEPEPAPDRSPTA